MRSDIATLWSKTEAHFPAVHSRRNPMSVSHPVWSDAYPAALRDEIQDGLAKLADIEAEFDEMVERLNRWQGSVVEKAEWLHIFEQRRNTRREPCAERIAALHNQMLKVTIY